MKNLKLLLIDDDKSCRDTLIRVLKLDGYNIFMAEDGKEGLKIVKEESPDIILLDLSMPVMRGEDFLKEIQHKVSDNQSIIVLSGYGTDDKIKLCYELGITVFLHKPFSIHELRGILKNTKITMDYRKKLENTIKELKEAKDEISQLQEILPICSGCKKIRNDNGDWIPVESYISSKIQSEFTHSLCIDCIEKLYPEEYKKMKNNPG